MVAEEEKEGMLKKRKKSEAGVEEVPRSCDGVFSISLTGCVAGV